MELSFSRSRGQNWKIPASNGPVSGDQSNQETVEKSVHGRERADHRDIEGAGSRREDSLRLRYLGGIPVSVDENCVPEDVGPNSSRKTWRLGAFPVTGERPLTGSRCRAAGNRGFERRY